MRKGLNLMKLQSLTTDKEDLNVSEEEDSCLSAQLNFLERNRLEVYRTKNLQDCDIMMNALDFDFLIKKTPFESDSTIRNESKKNFDMENVYCSTDYSQSKPTNSVTRFIRGQAILNGTTTTIRSADNSFERSGYSEGEIRSLDEYKQRPSSVEPSSATALPRGILKTGVKSRFSKDLKLDDLQISFIPRSKKSSSFRIPKHEPQKIINTKGVSSFRKQTVIRKK